MIDTPGLDCVTIPEAGAAWLGWGQASDRKAVLGRSTPYNHHGDTERALLFSPSP